MEKFTQVVESKRFMPDPSIIKKYAAHVVPLYLNGLLKCDEKLVDEYLELYKSSNKYKNASTVCDLEIEAIKAVLDNPLSLSGFTILKTEIKQGCPKLQDFLRRNLKTNFQ